MSKTIKIVVVLAALISVVATASPQSSRASGRSVALVVGSDPLSASDGQIAGAIAALGDTVEVVADDDLGTRPLDGFDVVVITSTVNPGIVPAEIVDVRVPMVVMEPALFDDFGLAQGGTERTQSAISIREPLHPLAAGLPSGSHTVLSTGTRVNAARVSELGAGAEVVATVVGSSGWAAIVGYPFAAPLIDGGTAPAGRVALFPTFGAILNETGISLVASAINWVDKEGPSDRPPVIVGVDTTTLPETGPSSTVLATFEGFDPDGDTFEFGCVCPGFLAVSAAGELRAVGDIDYETTPVVTIDVFIGARGDGIEQTFTFNVIDDPTDNVDNGDLEDTVAALAARIDELEALTDGGISDRLDALEATTADLVAANADLVAANDALEAANADLVAANAGMAASLSDLQDKYWSLDLRVWELETTTAEVSARAAENQSNISGHIISDQLFRVGITENIQTLQSTTAGHSTQLSGLATDLAGLEFDVAVLETDVEGIDTRVTANNAGVTFVYNTFINRLREGVSVQGRYLYAPNNGSIQLYCPATRPQPYAPSMSSTDQDFELVTAFETPSGVDANGFSTGLGYKFYFERRSFLDTTADEHVYASIRCL